MAFVRCSKCGHDTSDSLPTCMNCRAPIGSRASPAVHADVQATSDPSEPLRAMIAVRDVLEEDFGITGVEEPEQLRVLLESKLAEMNTLDRAAFQMRLG